MNSIDKRIARLKSEAPIPHKTKKVIDLEKEKEKHLKFQGYQCACCNLKFVKGSIEPHVDYADINRTKIRGLLCGKCYHLIQLSGSKIDTLENAANYLKNKCKTSSQKNEAQLINETVNNQPIISQPVRETEINVTNLSFEEYMRKINNQ